LVKVAAASVKMVMMGKIWHRTDGMGSDSGGVAIAFPAVDESKKP